MKKTQAQEAFDKHFQTAEEAIKVLQMRLLIFREKAAEGEGGSEHGEPETGATKHGELRGKRRMYVYCDSFSRSK